MIDNYDLYNRLNINMLLGGGNSLPVPSIRYLVFV